LGIARDVSASELQLTELITIFGSKDIHKLITRLKYLHTCILVLLLTISIQVNKSLASGNDEIPIANRALVHSIYLSNNIKIELWGFVNLPGRYILPDKTSLMQLLKAAGGLIQGAEPDRIRIFRKYDEEKTLPVKYNVWDIRYEFELWDGDIIFIPSKS